MLKRLVVSMVLALLAACVSRAPEPEPAPAAAPPPVEISEAPEPAPPPAEPPPDVPQKPAQTDSGRFRISIAALDRAELAPAWIAKAEAAGYRTEVLAVDIDGKTWHRVLLPGYASLDEARAALPFVQQELAPDAWITSRRRAPTPPDAAADAPPPPPPPAEPAEQEPTPAN